MDIKKWPTGIRLYIGVATVLIAAEVWWWASVTYGGSNVRIIRAEEVYAWLALICLQIAVSIGPFLKLAPGIPGKQLFRDSRRLIGIAAAVFATLHASISYVALFHVANPFSLASVYQRSFALGVLGLLVLLLMAFTSFDRAFHGLGIWWFRLHRLVYVAALAGVMHAFMVGSHASSVWVLFAVAVTTIALLGMHIVVAIRGRSTNLQIVTLAYMVLFAAAVFNYGLTQHLGHNLLLHWHDPGGHNHG
jgi:DMSO/TMAO reductase YedYZ heme-binding membrane subunit